MKTAIYVEDGLVQLVITPETVFEKKMIGMLEEGSVPAKIVYGSFYDCRGGWVSQSAFREPIYDHQVASVDRSLIVVVDARKAADD